VFEHGFCSYFTLEWIIRFFAFRSKLDCVKDRWFILDTALVFIMAVETWIFPLMMALSSGNFSSNIMSSLITVRVLKILRLARVARLAKLMRTVPELLILVRGVTAAFRSVMVTFLLLFAIVYVFALLFTQMTQGTPLHDRLFSSMTHSMASLALRATVPDLIETFEEDLGPENYLFSVLFVFFILICSITLMNLLVGLLVEIVNLTAIYEKEQLDVQFVKTYFISLASSMDVNGDKMISKTEFNNLMHMPEALRALEGVGVDILGLIDLADYMFRGRGSMALPDFLDLVLQLRGTNKATVKDIVDTRKFLVQSMSLLEQRLSSLIHNAMESQGVSIQPNHRKTEVEHLYGAIG